MLIATSQQCAVFRLRRGKMKQEAPPTTIRSAGSGSNRVALCVTGNERAVLKPVVRESMRKYIYGPVENNGGAVHTFLVIGVG
jgi:hypothetical protein